ncbi:DUF469 family protein [Photobacterium phosphoreum]|jgi:hypothetical protein|uniref:DUF469 family protein n=1 Tax=Photobacterium phosphoreum TaxID=659 RepID=A0AAW5A1R6_PHOPO|nr:50S ribosome-binding protein YggL [Photobacterium phosphoreum]MCD9493210.1 DUF469 family protein [Photobacterium phosphoreum]MCD9501659.1 DUF469 family protein [Photobacterium phosphoreum]MCD9506565.1 DUF469 family protein [Photobacterium phosphoreum]MCD9510167.1 DUF469 family protein [Photobacterium phosphoreum]MCD9517505.1 DUF469 family protein [Photobacterium phosphoreum]
MKLDKVHNKSKRLRKKLYLGEFAVFGFEVTCKLKHVSDVEFDVFIDDIIDVIESRNLIGGGGGSLNDYSLFICGDGRYSSASESDRAYIKDWLEINACTNSIIIGDLVDAYYGVY